MVAGAGLVSGAPHLSGTALAQAAGKIVIIGGGPGGIAVASRLKAANQSFDVTLVEPKQKYTTCFHSNLYIGGFRSFQSITHDYEAVKTRGIRVVNDMATAVDTSAKTITVARGGTAIP